jgi:hypothetical protein
MSDLFQFLVNDDRAAYLVAAIIIGVALQRYFFWFSAAIERLQDALLKVNRALSDGAVSSDETLKSVRENAGQHPAVFAAWVETERRVVNLPTESGYQARLLGSPRDLWSASRLLSRSINLQLAEAIPNLLVGVGLLFTFFFLTLAITDAASIIGSTTAVSSDGSTTDFVDQAGRMLRAAGAKFTTSLAGLLASIVWTIAMRRRMAVLSALCDETTEALERYAPSSGVEDLLHLHAKTIVALEKNAIDSLDISNEILEQSREQTGALKRFETDLAVSLAGAITSAFAPQMEVMTDRLTGAIKDLSQNLTAINQDALKELLADFKSGLKENTAAEMDGFRAALVTLAEKLDTAGASIGQGATAAATRIGEAGDGLVSKVDTVATTLTDGAANLEVASQSLKESVNDLDVMLQRATTQGEVGVEFLNGVFRSGETLLELLRTTGESLQTTAGLLDGAARRLGETFDGVEELTAEQHALVREAREAAPIATAAINNVTTQLTTAITTTETAMAATRRSIQEASAALTTTVNAITTGVTEYTELVARLHTEMDRQLAGAIGRLDTTVNNLGESMEEMTESLAEIRGRTA